MADNRNWRNDSDRDWDQNYERRSNRNYGNDNNDNFGGSAWNFRSDYEDRPPHTDLQGDTGDDMNRHRSFSGDYNYSGNRSGNDYRESSYNQGNTNDRYDRGRAGRDYEYDRYKDYNSGRSDRYRSYGSGTDYDSDDRRNPYRENERSSSRNSGNYGNRLGGNRYGSNYDNPANTRRSGSDYNHRNRSNDFNTARQDNRSYERYDSPNLGNEAYGNRSRSHSNENRFGSGYNSGRYGNRNEYYGAGAYRRDFNSGFSDRNANRSPYAQSNYGRNYDYPGSHNPDVWESGNQWSGQHRGKGPKGYQRSEERIREDVCDRLGDDHHLDASDIEVKVSGSTVTLSGTVNDKRQKRHAEDIVEDISGVREVENNLKIKAGETEKNNNDNGGNKNTGNM